MSELPISKLPDDDMKAAPAALLRAARAARELAQKTGTAGDAVLPITPSSIGQSNNQILK